MRLTVRLNNDGVKNADGTQKPLIISEANAENLRIEDGALAYDVAGKTRYVSLRDLANWRIDGGPRQFVGDGTVDGPLFAPE